MRLAANRSPIGHVDEQSERGKIVLDFVDRFLGPDGRRPIEFGSAGRRRVPLKLLVVRDLADDGAHDVEDVEGGHARAGAADVETRIGQPQAIGGGADGQPEQEPLGLGAIVLHDEARAGAAPLSGTRISRSRSSGSSRSFCGKSRSARPGTNTTLNARPRA